jgi:hypothetical protein
MLTRSFLALALGALYASATPLVIRNNSSTQPGVSQSSGAPQSSGIAQPSGASSAASGASGSSVSMEISTPTPNIAPSQAPDATVVSSGVPTGFLGTIVPPGPVVSPTAAPGSPPPPAPPAGGVGLNDTPAYVFWSDYDFQSLVCRFFYSIHNFD